MTSASTGRSTWSPAWRSATGPLSWNTGGAA